MMLWAAGLSLMIGIVPAPFVSTATDAHDVIARPSLGAHHGRETTRIEPRQQDPSA